MNLTKQCPLLLLFSKYYDVCVHKYWYSTFRRHYLLSNRTLPFVETSIVLPKPLKCFNFYLCTKNCDCWNCGSAVASLFCGKCNSLQKVNKKSTYFELLGLEANYDLKLSDLSKKYRQLQSVLHPDKFANKNSEEKIISEEYSSLINKAYSTLSNPISRGLYMLKLKGSSIEEDMIQLDTKFLMEIVEKNEEVEDAFDSDQIKEYNEINKKSMNSLIEELSRAFNEDDINTAKMVLTKLKYYSSIDLKIKQMKQKLGIPD